MITEAKEALPEKLIEWRIGLDIFYKDRVDPVLFEYVEQSNQ